METNKTKAGNTLIEIIILKLMRMVISLKGSKPLRFKLIATEAMNYPITILCRCMKASKSGYYY
jgi:hypothetical protein